MVHYARSPGTMRLITLVSKTREYAIAVPWVVIGSGEEADVVIGDPTVSRKHALIRRRLGQYAVTDLDSTNGTYVNGRRIERSATIKPGDKLTLRGRAASDCPRIQKSCHFNYNRENIIAADARRLRVSPLHLRSKLEPP